jgi:endonuclease III
VKTEKPVSATSGKAEKRRPDNAKSNKLPKNSADQRNRAAALLAELYENYPNPHCALNFTNPFELLIATILSAQCTDVRVNIVTEELFRIWPTPQAMSEAPLPELEEVIRTTGFYRNKALAIREASRKIVDDYGGEVPRTMDELLSLRGAARKTANVVLGNAFGLNEGVVVDTHVKRLANRFGLTRHQDPVKIERDLMALYPQEEWTNLSHLLIAHGRAACKARFSTPPDHPVCEKYGIGCTCNSKRSKGTSP